MIEKIKQRISENKIEYLVILGIIILAFGFMVMNNKPAVHNENIFKYEKPIKKTVDEKPAPKEIYVDIQGEVNHPGLYRIKSNSRVFDLLKLAGGLKNSADRKNVNQAKKLADQEQVYIPKIGEEPTTTAPTDSKSDIGEPVNINAATAEELQNLPGVGPKKAEKIVQYREQNGGFQKIDDLTKVSGFGEKTVASLKEQLTI